MASAAPPPLQPPQLPARTNQAAVAVLIGVIAVICLVVGLGVLAITSIVRGTRIRTTGSGASQMVDIRSPLGNLHVNGSGNNAKVDIDSPFGAIHVDPTPDVARLDMPVYPGAVLVTHPADSTFHRGDFDDVGINATQVRMQAGGKALNVNVAEFRTSAPVEQVLDFYTQKLREFGRIERRRHGREQSVEVRIGDDNARVAAVERGDDGTHFMLVRVMGGEADK